LTGVYKESKDFIGTLNTKAEYEVIDYYDEYGDQIIQIYNQTNPGENYYLTTNPGNKTNYKALILAFRKRLSHNWHLDGSLTLSRSRRYPKGYSDKNSLINNWGVPDTYDREYLLKLSGTYIFPYGIVFSAYFAHQQGRPFNRTIAVRLNQGRRTIAAEPRGSKRLPSQTYLDLRLEKDFRIWKTARLKLILDVWNIFNADYYSYVAETNAASEAYLAPAGYALPRRAQLGFRLVF